MKAEIVKKEPLPESPSPRRQTVVLLCGSISLRRRVFTEAASAAAGITIVRCAEDPEVFSFAVQLNASLVIARQGFIEQIPEAGVLLITNLGKRCPVLAVLESETLEPVAVNRMLRLGCKGILPHRFSPKIFRRAVLAVLKGEIWAPPALVSQLVSDILRAASLKSEHGLTSQEARILELSLQGWTNSAIADALFISLGTVRWHKRRLNRKLRLSKQPGRPQTTAQVTPLHRIFAAGEGSARQA